MGTSDRHPRTRRALGLLGLFASLALLAAVVAAGAAAATREPIAAMNAALRDPGDGGGVVPPLLPPGERGLASPDRGRDLYGDQGPLAVSSTFYGPEQTAAVASTLAGLDHGPEIGRLSVYVASPAELAATCGATVVACYSPQKLEMFVSGQGQGSSGVSRAFAIAHEYGHHIANTQSAELEAPIDAGTIRWATYERVCQLTRRGVLFPGNQGAHYWEDPEEAFAESYAHLAEPAARVSWQYAPVLRPTRASLTRLQADVSRPWQGPTTFAWNGPVPAPATPGPPRRLAAGSQAGLFGAVAVSPRPGTVGRALRTPLDGTVSVSLRAPAAADLALTLRDAPGGRALARAVTGEGGVGAISYANCGRDSLWLEVRGLTGGGEFEATISRP